MSGRLAITIGQHSDKGIKEVNQDFHGALIPEEPLKTLKGIAVVIADGISSSDVSAIASETAVKSFLTDYYCTPDSWSVKTSARRVIAATNSWLHLQTRHSQRLYDKDRGYVCTLSALVLKSRTAHFFHIGDARIYRLSGNSLEQLTEDHRVAVSSEQSYLGRALGVNPEIEIDYGTFELEAGAHILLATDGVYEHVSPRFIAETIASASNDLDRAAERIIAEALRLGSPDNLTVQILRIDALPDGERHELIRQASQLPSAPLLDARMAFEGYRVVREIHASSRSHIYLATDSADGALVALKTPSIDLRDDPDYLQRLMMEEWIARRIDNAHVLKARALSRPRNFTYVVMEFVEGQSLTQWMIDHPNPDLGTVRNVIEQIGKGLQAFHRLEMLHQDLRPDNIMIDKTGTVKIIDFGSAEIAGIADDMPPGRPRPILGTAQYTAPEYFLGEGGSPRSDIFSLGVIAYQMLTGRLPYGAEVAKTRTRAQQGRLQYQSVLDHNSVLPVWIDGALKRAVHPDPNLRYRELSEFMYDFSHPNRKYLRPSGGPLLERNPLLFWKCVSALLLAAVAVLLGILMSNR